MISIMRRRDTMESQTIGRQTMTACHRGETETPMPISGIVGERILGLLMTRVSLNPRHMNISPRAKNCPTLNPLWVTSHHDRLDRI